jgi:hypothetical protein
MTTTRWSFAVALAAGVWLACNAFSQDKGDAMSTATKPPANAPETTMQEGMRRWEQCTTPGPMHKQLERFLGKWKIEASMYGIAPEAVKSEGTSEWRWLFEGRFIQQTWRSDVMGAPSGGQVTIGYDNFKQKFVTSDVNTFQTALLTSEGNFDQPGETLITYGFTDSPITGECDRLAKYVWRFEGKDTFTFELHDPSAPAGNTKALEVVYTRQK